MSSLKILSLVLGVLVAIALSAVLIGVLPNPFQNSPEVGLDLKTNPVFTQNFSEYSHNGFKLKYPKDWAIEKYQPNEFSQIVAELIPPDRDSQALIAPIVTIEVRPLSKTASLATVNQEATQAINNFLPNAKIFENKEFYLDNSPAYLLIYTGLDGQNKLQRMQAGIIKNDYLYLIIYEAQVKQYKKYEATVKQIINSFKFF